MARSDFGISASVLLAVGLLPPYFELAKRKGRVIGINFAFLFIDSLGAWLSIISVILGNMDIMGIILYSIVAGMELGIFASHFIWWCRFRFLAKGNTFDEESGQAQKEEPDEKSNKILARVTKMLLTITWITVQSPTMLRALQTILIYTIVLMGDVIKSPNIACCPWSCG